MATSACHLGSAVSASSPQSRAKLTLIAVALDDRLRGKVSAVRPAEDASGCTFYSYEALPPTSPVTMSLLRGQRWILRRRRSRRRHQRRYRRPDCERMERSHSELALLLICRSISAMSALKALGASAPARHDWWKAAERCFAWARYYGSRSIARVFRCQRNERARSFIQHVHAERDVRLIYANMRHSASKPVNGAKASSYICQVLHGTHGMPCGGSASPANANKVAYQGFYEKLPTSAETVSILLQWLAATITFHLSFFPGSPPASSQT